MIVSQQQTTWADNDSSKDLEALLFAVPDDIKNKSSEQLRATNVKNVVIGKPDVKKRCAVQRKIPTTEDTAKGTGKIYQVIKPKPPMAARKLAPVKKITASTPKANAKKSQSDEDEVLSCMPKSSRKSRVVKHQVAIPIPESLDKSSNPCKHSGTIVLQTGLKDAVSGNSRKSPVTNLQLLKDTALTGSGTTGTHKKEQKADHPIPHKSDWKKRAFSKLMQKDTFPRSRPPQKSGNEPQSFRKAGTVHDTKRRKLKRDANSTDNVQSVISKPTEGIVHDPKRRKLEKDTRTTSTIGPTESRSEALNRAVTSKLMAAQFRFINEQLYTRSSKEAKKLFTKDKKLFQVYHDGYSQQISRWPTNPLDAIISFIQKKPSNWVIGDFGCGDAKLARSVKNKVHSFDLVASNDRVTVADIAHVPLPNGSLDIAVLCLSLMGTNFVDFISEANRTLKVRGTLLISEIESRFKNVLKFKNLMKNMGFQLKKEEKNSYFISFNFMKTRSPNREFKTAAGLLKPCVYKKR